jgi:thiamine phosphate synthase YjbQ (UPF0047 family)
MDRTLPLLSLELRPDQRPEALDLRPRLSADLGISAGALPARLLCISYHTTAGFLDRSLRTRVGRDPRRLEGFLDSLVQFFPPEAGYEHDRLHLRDELTEAQKLCEPLNADAHLAFIGGGFTNCTTYELDSGEPIWFVDFDGIYRDREDRPIQRVRKATLLGFDHEEVMLRLPLEVEVPAGAVALNLGDPQVGILSRLQDEVGRLGIQHGRVTLRLDAREMDAGLTVNEYEALLMSRDLIEVLERPFHFVQAVAERFSKTPLAAPVEAAASALTRALEALGISPSRQRRILERALASTSPRVLRMRRHANLAVLPSDGFNGAGKIVQGTYQAPILVQRSGPSSGRRRIIATIRKLV